MKVVHLSNTFGNVKKKYIGFSFLYFFLGPVYLLCRFRFLLAIIITMFYFYLLPIPGMDFIIRLANPLLSGPLYDSYARFMNFFRGEYIRYAGIIIIVFFHTYLSFYIEGMLLRKVIKKKKLLPITENDARLLISHHACKENIILAMSTYETINNNDIHPLKTVDVPYIVQTSPSELIIHKESEKRRKIQQLNEIYSLGQITREEYELRRAMIIKTYK